MSWGQVGREREDEPSPPTSAFRWVAVGALFLAVVLFAVAFLVAQQRDAPRSRAVAATSTAPGTSSPPPPGTPLPSEPSAPQTPPSTEGDEGPSVDRELFDLSGGDTQGWQFGAWQEGAQGEVVPVPPPAEGVTIVSPGGNGWFRAPFAAPVDLSGAKTLSYDVDGGGTDVIVAMSIGPQGAWCETDGGRTPPGSYTVTVALSSLLDGCLEEVAQPRDLSDVRSLQVWFSEGTFTLSSVRVSG